MARTINIPVCIAALILTFAAHAADFHLSPSGSDADPGTQAKPFRTLTRARDAVRQLKAAKGLPPGGVQILLAEGEYALSETLVLTPEDSGEDGGLVCYRPMPDAHPTISGARLIDGWRKLTNAVPGLTDKAKGKVFAADVPKGWRFHALYVQGQPQQTARWPNHYDWRRWPRLVKPDKPDPNGVAVRFPTDAPLAHLPGNGDVELIQVPDPWWNVIAVVRSIDPTAGTAVLQTRNTIRPKPSPSGTNASGGEFCLLNGLPLLDEPGEWCVDSAAGKVYYWPPDGSMEGKKALAPALPELVRFQGDPEGEPAVHHVVLSGLTFRYADRLAEDQWPDSWLKRNSENPDGAIFMEGVEDCQFSENAVTDVGAYGIVLAHHAMRVAVLGNEIGRTGSGGICLYGWGPGTLDVNRENLISCNYVHDVGLAPYWHSSAISLYASGDNSISHNYLQNLSYCGISIAGVREDSLRARPAEPRLLATENSMYQIRWTEWPDSGVDRATVKDFLHSGNNRICRNVVSDYVRWTGEGAAFYAWGCGNGNVWSENVVVRQAPAKGSSCIHMDDGVDRAVVESNLCWGPVETAWFDSSRSPDGAGVAEMSTGDEPPVKPASPAGRTTNVYRNNAAGVTAKPAGYDVLLGAITRDVQRQGGWKGNPPPPASPIR